MILFWISAICFFQPKIQSIVSQFAKLFNSNKDQDEILNLKKELAGTSLTSEYTKYVKIERKLLSLQSSQSNRSIVPKTYIVQKTIAFILNTILAVISIAYRSEVAIVFEQRYNFSALGKIMSFPVGCMNSLSIVLWIIINKYSAKILYNILKA